MIDILRRMWHLTSIEKLSGICPHQKREITFYGHADIFISHKTPQPPLTLFSTTFRKMTVWYIKNRENARCKEVVSNVISFNYALNTYIRTDCWFTAFFYNLFMKRSDIMFKVPDSLNAWVSWAWTRQGSFSPVDGRRDYAFWEWVGMHLRLTALHPTKVGRMGTNFAQPHTRKKGIPTGRS